MTRRRGVGCRPTTRTAPAVNETYGVKTNPLSCRIPSIERYVRYSRLLMWCLAVLVANEAKPRRPRFSSWRGGRGGGGRVRAGPGAWRRARYGHKGGGDKPNQQVFVRGVSAPAGAEVEPHQQGGGARVPRRAGCSLATFLPAARAACVAASAATSALTPRAASAPASSPPGCAHRATSLEHRGSHQPRRDG